MAAIPDDLTVARARRGDRDAVDALLRAHYDMIRAVCHRIVINPADADDATQSALISVVRALPRFDGRSKFSTWAYRIAVNAALDEVRRIRRRPLPAGDPTTPENGTVHGIALVADAPDPASAVESQMVVRAALEQVPEDYRVALVLRHVADLEYEEIAVILDVPVGTVRSRLSRGREHLTRLLADGNPDDPGGRHTGGTDRGATRPPAREGHR